MNTLIFTNLMASPQTRRIELSADSDYQAVIRWYAAFYSGDNFTVTLNGKILKTDADGNIEE